ncbi:cbb3-type cytochrome c oxidase subunit 3 [Ochrobactrum sp. MC-1LL]|uniref:cbb3-type cytochrome c oxidase subunit 3 n=1 Tax=Ochrobactrum sp. MC-1LL TaxID=2735351 RepID=UPI0014384B30|nr:cbb3-type cytochrome c oxidase subunit 3 [Ochrobactrum sp. MC-1LL]NKE74222.1 cbb3-type cytochrome c oxidase subunit 3 [Ochrobactrum sp. MC-1LL]
MSQYLISIFLNGWLVVATLLFLAIIWRVFRPSARSQMEQHGLIPFEDEGGRQ